MKVWSKFKMTAFYQEVYIQGINLLITAGVFCSISCELTFLVKKTLG